MNLVRFFTQSLYDTALLTTGVLCLVNFTSVYLPNKSLAQINIHDVSSWLQTNIFDFETETLFALANDPVVRIAIADIKYACIELDLTALFSFRSIEGIMNSFSENPEDDRKNNWTLLREQLNISRDFFKPVEEFSKLNRHAKPFGQLFSNRQICISSAMIVLQRYLHYLKNGKAKLDSNKFPEINTVEEFGMKSF